MFSEDKYVTVHEKNLRNLATEMNKVLNNLSPEIVKDIFKTKTNHCSTLNALIFSKRNVKTVRYGLQTIS